MSRIAPQTQRAIDALRSIGIPRKHFSVSSPFNKKVGGYVDTLITLLRKSAYQTAFDHAAELNAAGYDVTAYFLPGAEEGKPSSVGVSVAAVYGKAVFTKTQY